MKWPDGTGEQLLYYDYLTRYGATARERSIVRTKQDFERFVVDDPGVPGGLHPQRGASAVPYHPHRFSHPV